MSKAFKIVQNCSPINRDKQDGSKLNALALNAAGFEHEALNNY